jgi:hypothetical protein
LIDSLLNCGQNSVANALSHRQSKSINGRQFFNARGTNLAYALKDFIRTKD